MSVRLRKRLLLPFISLGLMWGGLFAPSGRALAATGNPLDFNVTVTVLPETPPANISDLVAVPGTAEGEVKLTWTSPGDDGILGDLVNSKFLIKFSTAQIDTWTDPANIVISTNAIALSSQTYFVQNLEPGVTYYFAILAEDDIGQRNTWSRSGGTNANNFAIATDLAPPTPSGFSIVGGNNQLTLSWNAVAVGDLDFYRLHIDSTPPYDFGNVFTINVSSTATSFVHAGLTNGNTYFYFITSVDRGSPAFPGLALESPPSSIVSMAPGDTLPPAAVAGLSGQLSADGLTFNIMWDTVTTNANGTPIADLSLYRILKSTGLFAPTTATFNLPASQTSFADTVNNNVFYYKVRAVDTSANESMDSNSIISQAKANILAPADDGKTFLIISDQVATELHKANNAAGSNLVIVPVRLPAEETGNVLKSYRFEARRAEDNQPVTQFSFSKPMVNVLFGFVTGSGIGSLNHTDKKLSIYWNNGARFISLGGHLNFTEGTVNVLSSNVGRYQLRLLSGAADTLLTDGSPYPRVITPNGDGINDRVFFFFEATDAPKDGRIYDLNGALVGSLKSGPVPDSSLVWDGKDDRGNVVPMGVYLYKISIGDKNATGTVVVAR